MENSNFLDFEIAASLWFISSSEELREELKTVWTVHEVQSVFNAVRLLWSSYDMNYKTILAESPLQILQRPAAFSFLSTDFSIWLAKQTTCESIQKGVN